MLDSELESYINEVKNRLWDPKYSKHDEDEFKHRLTDLLNSANEKKLQDVFVFLFENFSFYSQENVNKHLKDLYLLICNEKIDISKCLFTYIKRKDGKINSSIDYAMDFKHLNDIPKQQFTDDINALIGYWEHINNIILIDDCCGTGGTLKSFIEDLKLDFSNKTLYYLVIHQMVESDVFFQSLESMFSNFKIKCLAVNKTEKVFNSVEIASYKDKFKIFSQEKGINEDLVFGYKESEAIFAFYNNTPNNTLGIFHAYSKGKNLPLFPRESNSQKKPFWVKAKEDKEKRNNMLANKAKPQKIL